MSDSQFAPSVQCPKCGAEASDVEYHELIVSTGKCWRCNTRIDDKPAAVDTSAEAVERAANWLERRSADDIEAGAAATLRALLSDRDRLARELDAARGLLAACRALVAARSLVSGCADATENAAYMAQVAIADWEKAAIAAREGKRP